MDSLFSSDRNRFQFFPCCFACNPLPASPRGVVRSRCDNLFGNIAAEQKFWCTFLELRPCRLSNFPRFDFARDHLAHPWSRNHSPIFRTAFWLFGTIGIVLGCCWRCRCISASFLVLWTSGGLRDRASCIWRDLSIAGRSAPTTYALVFGHGACSLEHRRCGLLCLSAPHVHGRNVRSDESLFFVCNSCHWCSYGREDLCLITGP